MVICINHNSNFRHISCAVYVSIFNNALSKYPVSFHTGMFLFIYYIRKPLYDIYMSSSNGYIYRIECYAES